MIKRLFAPMMVLSLGLALGSCAQFSGFVSDHWPTWAGGMSNDVPPRPGTPGYDEFIAHQQVKKDATTPAAAAEKTNAQAAPSGNRPANDQDVVQGGLY
jgi:hypothetical protein